MEYRSNNIWQALRHICGDFVLNVILNSLLFVYVFYNIDYRHTNGTKNDISSDEAKKSVYHFRDIKKNVFYFCAIH